MTSPSVFLEERLFWRNWFVIVVSLEGTRPILTEVQCLPMKQPLEMRAVRQVVWTIIVSRLMAVQKRAGSFIAKTKMRVNRWFEATNDYDRLSDCDDDYIASYKEKEHKWAIALSAKSGLTGEIREMNRVT